MASLLRPLAPVGSSPLVPVGSYLPVDPVFESIEIMRTDARYRRKVTKRAAHASYSPNPGRTAIVRLSEGSRQRALKALRNGPEWTTFATVTFPYEVTDGRKAKAPLKRLLARLERRKTTSYWSLEFQRSGRAHFHLLLTEDLSTEQLRTMWAGALGHEGRVYVHAGRVRDQESAIYYAVKAKGHWSRIVPEGFTSPGRFWGNRGLDSRPKSLLRIEAPPEIMARIWRPLRKLYASYARRLGLRRSRDNGVVGRFLWELGGVSVARALLRLVESLTGEEGRNQFRLDGLLFAQEGVSRA